ncbi:hypothetical protein Hanom_Chr12g01132151 [Helianthus anomalus]
MGYVTWFHYIAVYIPMDEKLGLQVRVAGKTEYNFEVLELNLIIMSFIFALDIFTFYELLYSI